jgi:hypothetical protein
VYGAGEAKLHCVSELRRCEHVRKRKLALVQHLSRTRSVTLWKPCTSSIQKVSRWQPRVQQMFSYSNQTPRIQYQAKQVWISRTRPWKTFEWTAVSGNVRHYYTNNVQYCVFVTRTTTTEHAFATEFPLYSHFCLCPYTSLVMYWETRSYEHKSWSLISYCTDFKSCTSTGSSGKN